MSLHGGDQDVQQAGERHRTFALAMGENGMNRASRTPCRWAMAGSLGAGRCGHVFCYQLTALCQEKLPRIARDTGNTHRAWYQQILGRIPHAPRCSA